MDTVGESCNNFIEAWELQAWLEELILSIFQVQSGQTKAKIKLFFPVVLLLPFSRDNPAKIENVYRIMPRVVASHPQE